MLYNDEVPDQATNLLASWLYTGVPGQRGLLNFISNVPANVQLCWHAGQRNSLVRLGAWGHQEAACP
jgi:hypothetical protein